MKNWIRIFLVCFVLVGGTAFFANYSLNQFNKALDDISASTLAIAKIPPVSVSDKTNKEQTPTSTPEIVPTSAVLGITISTSTPTSTSTPETVPTSATSTDFKLSFIFPKISNEVYIGCTYQLSFQSSTVINSLETTLFDAGTSDPIKPTASGLARENTIDPNSQSFDWKIGVVWPGEYYIKVSGISGVDLKSNAFTISKMPKGISANEREKICKESYGLL